MFIQCIGAFRLGDVVQLNTNERGIIVKLNSNFPARPVLKIIYDKRQLRLLNTYLIDLSAPKNSTLNIEKVLG